MITTKLKRVAKYWSQPDQSAQISRENSASKTIAIKHCQKLLCTVNDLYKLLDHILFHKKETEARVNYMISFLIPCSSSFAHSVNISPVVGLELTLSLWK